MNLKQTLLVIFILISYNFVSAQNKLEKEQSNELHSFLEIVNTTFSHSNLEIEAKYFERDLIEGHMFEIARGGIKVYEFDTIIKGFLNEARESTTLPGNERALYLTELNAIFDSYIERIERTYKYRSEQKAKNEVKEIYRELLTEINQSNLLLIDLTPILYERLVNRLIENINLDKFLETYQFQENEKYQEIPLLVDGKAVKYKFIKSEKYNLGPTKFKMIEDKPNENTKPKKNEIIEILTAKTVVKDQRLQLEVKLVSNDKIAHYPIAPYTPYDKQHIMLLPLLSSDLHQQVKESLYTNMAYLIGSQILRDISYQAKDNALRSQRIANNIISQATNIIKYNETIIQLDTNANKEQLNEGVIDFGTENEVQRKQKSFYYVSTENFTNKIETISAIDKFIESAKANQSISNEFLTEVIKIESHIIDLFVSFSESSSQIMKNLEKLEILKADVKSHEYGDYLKKLAEVKPQIDELLRLQNKLLPTLNSYYDLVETTVNEGNMQEISNQPDQKGKYRDKTVEINRAQNFEGLNIIIGNKPLRTQSLNNMVKDLETLSNLSFARLVDSQAESQKILESTQNQLVQCKALF